MFNETKSEAFSEKMIDILNYGALSLMVSIGHRTGLFDAMSQLDPSSSKQIAVTAGLNERYVREWLGAMVTGRIVEYDPNRMTYFLPPEHAKWLTRQTPADNIAVFPQYISVLGAVEDQIVECFKKGGGVPYSEFKRFHEVMTEDSGQTVVSSLIDHIIPLVPGLRKLLEKGIEVLDVGCGSGFALNLLAGNFPDSHFFGFDLSEEAIRAAKEKTHQNGNLHFEAKDTREWDELEKYDLITTFDAIHDQADPQMVLSKIFQALKADGTYLMQDIAASSQLHKNIDHPVGPFLYTISCMHCMSVSLAQNGAGLGTMWGKELACEMLEKAGFTHIEIKQLPHDFQNYFYIVRKKDKGKQSQSVST
jgi:2-polyprenyl-3-methyl-5-hydroxy-6-metoxy-1,4-benzoquinol methylase